MIFSLLLCWLKCPSNFFAWIDMAFVADILAENNCNKFDTLFFFNLKFDFV